MAEYNAEIAENRAKSIAEQSRLAQETHERRLRRFLSTQRTRIAGAGVGLEGSALLALEETAAEGELDSLAIGYASELGQADAMAQAAADRMQAKAFRSQGNLSAASTLLYGAASWGSNYGGMLNSGGGTTRPYDAGATRSGVYGDGLRG